MDIYYPPKPRSGRWPTRDSLKAHIAERHGRPDIDEIPRGSVFAEHALEDGLLPFDLPVLRRMHAAWHNPDAGPDHAH